MSMRLTLDTNICSYVLRRRPVAMVERFAGLEKSQVWLSSIVAAELRNGAAPQTAIHIGYDRAWSTILDSNVTTLIAGLALLSTAC